MQVCLFFCYFKKKKYVARWTELKWDLVRSTWVWVVLLCWVSGEKHLFPSFSFFHPEKDFPSLRFSAFLSLFSGPPVVLSVFTWVVGLVSYYGCIKEEYESFMYEPGTILHAKHGLSLSLFLDQCLAGLIASFYCCFGGGGGAAFFSFSSLLFPFFFCLVSFKK